VDPRERGLNCRYRVVSGRREVCLRLLGKKLLLALDMEGKLTCDGLQTVDGDDDLLTAMARALVESRGIGKRPNQSGNLAELRPSAVKQIEVEPAPELTPTSWRGGFSLGH
jgi:hypothetical protein